MKKLGIIEAAMKHRQIVLLLVSLMGIIGLYALMVMPRQEFPSFTIRQGLVIGVYPGASPEEIEQQLTCKVEEYLFGYNEINKKKTRSISKNGMMIIFVELNDNVSNSDEFWSKLNHGLNQFKMHLPSGVLAMIVNSEFGDTSALLITLESNNATPRELEGYMKKLEARLRQIESVSKLQHSGLQNEQISIYIEKKKLTNYGISSTTLMGSLFTRGFTTASGSVENDNTVTPIYISPSFNSEKEIAEQIIYSDPAGNMIRLKDVARIVREYPDPDNYITNNGHNCVLISMEMQKGHNIVKYGKEVDRVLEEFKKELPSDVHIERIADQPKVVGNSISAFLREMLYAIVAVILVTMILLPLRVAAVAATTIPISIFVSLAIMYTGGMELNTVTLAGLIVVLGMIVDNSIVIIDSYMEELDHGMSRWHAAIKSARTYFKAIFSATLAISITFFPFLFTLKGMFQEFVLMFPWTLTITLGVSLIIAMLLIPYMEYFFIRTGFKKAEKKKKRRNMLDIIQQTYEKWLVSAFKHPKVTMFSALLVIIFGVFLFTKAPRRLMPTAERDQFAVEIYLPQGTSLEQTVDVATSMEEILQADERVMSVTSFNGASSPRFHTTYAPNLPGSNYAQFIVNTRSAKETVNILDEYTTKYSDYFPNAHVRFKQMDYQKVQFPIEVHILGDDMDDLKLSADKLMAELRQVPGLTWIHTDFEEMLPVARIDIKQTEANRLGVNRATIATNLAIRFGELPLTTVWENDYPVPVKLKTEEEKSPELSDIENEYVHSIIPGVTVPLRQVADVKPGWEQGQVVRRNGIRTISILADVDRDVNVNHVFSKVRKISDNIELRSGQSIQYGGVYESDMETMPQIISGLIIAIFMIFMILLFHFKKINLALLTLGSSSLSLIGAIAGLMIMGKEFGITSILGIISLIGILVRNGIIMLDYAEELRNDKGYTALKAAFEAGKRRMRPIFLTSAAASMGVIPMIISNSPLWSPMGTIICFGTMTSMVLLVLILPVSYWLIFKNTDKNKEKETIEQLSNSGNMKPAILSILLIVCVSPFANAQSYTLEQCKEMALHNNVEVKNSELSVRSAQAVKKAASTKYFPHVDATAVAFQFDKDLIEMEIEGGNLPVYDGNPANLPNATQFAYFPGINMSMIDNGVVGMATAIQPIYMGLQISTGNKLANLGVEASELQLTSVKNQIALQTEKQYWQIVALEERKKTLERYIEMVDTLHKEVNDAVTAGLTTRNDLLKVELEQNELQMNILQLNNGIELSKMSFCQFLGVEYREGVEFPGNIPQVQNPSDIYTDHGQALGLRSEYQILQKSVQAEEFKTKMTRGEHLPQVGVGATAMYMDVMDKGQVFGGIFGTVRIPISAWWEGTHKMKERKLKEEQSRNIAADNTEKLLLQMQLAKNTLEEAYRQVQLAEKSVNQSEENLRINRDHYEAGLINISDMLDAQAQVQQSGNKMTDALSNFRVAQVNYQQVTGSY